MNDARESSRRLADLLRREHAALAAFLVALADFDRQRLWLRLGFPNLFEFLHRELGLSRGAAHYRKVAARLVQKFPEVVEPLADGRLCMSSILQLAKVMTEANRAAVLPRFFHCSKQEAKEVAVAILPAAVIPRKEMVTAHAAPPERVHPDEREVTHPKQDAAPPPMKLEPLTSDLHRLHATVSKQFLDKLDRARAGQSHVQPGASREQVLEAALDLLLEQQARRRGEVKRPQQNPRPASPDHVTAAVRREVWARLEVDHVVPRGRGGPSTAANCRLICRVHNVLAARQVYGDAHMDLFTGRVGEGEPPPGDAVRPTPPARRASTPAPG